MAPRNVSGIVQKNALMAILVNQKANFLLPVALARMIPLAFVYIPEPADGTFRSASVAMPAAAPLIVTIPCGFKSTGSGQG